MFCLAQKLHYAYIYSYAIFLCLFLYIYFYIQAYIAKFIFVISFIRSPNNVTPQISCCFCCFSRKTKSNPDLGLAWSFTTILEKTIHDFSGLFEIFLKSNIAMHKCCSFFLETKHFVQKQEWYKKTDLQHLTFPINPEFKLKQSKFSNKSKDYVEH